MKLSSDVSEQKETIELPSGMFGLKAAGEMFSWPHSSSGNISRWLRRIDLRAGDII